VSPDPGTAIENVGAAAIAAKYFGASVGRILGPTADYLGGELQEWTEKRAENVGRIFRNAERKLGPEGLKSDGSVPPRVLGAILSEGQFRDDALAADYLGGVLASAKTEDGRDDRGAALVALVSRLSTYQLRAHYMLYAQARNALAGRDLNLGEQSVRKTNVLFLPMADFLAGMDFSNAEMVDFAGVLSHVVHGLIREGLLEDEFRYGGPSALGSMTSGPDFRPMGGILFRITPLGIELFMMAHGLGRGHPMSTYVDSRVNLEFDTSVAVSTAGLVADLPRIQPPE
jgi:hypothetical protein